MATVMYRDISFECTKAIKGENYIHLLDEDGTMIAAFDGVSEFSNFSISDGEWVDPTATSECFLAVIREDGSIGKGTHKCCDLPSVEETWTFTLKDGATVEKKVMLA